MKKIVQCACGCGQEFVTPHWGREKKFVRGHHSRVQKAGKVQSHLQAVNERKKIEHIVVEGIEGKMCRKCGGWKALDCFGAGDLSDGLDNRCKACLAEKALNHYRKNRDRIVQKRKEPEERRKALTLTERWRKMKMATDLSYRIGRKLRVKLYKLIKRGGGKKSAKTIDLLGCSIDYFVSYLESKFRDGMNWNNYGQPGWEIDHIRPVSSFDLTDPEEQRKCFHYTNHQPLWGPDNNSKRSKWGEKR